MMTANRIGPHADGEDDFSPLAIDRAFIQTLRRFLQELVSGSKMTSAALMLRAYQGDEARYLVLGDQPLPAELGETEEFIVSSLQPMPLGGQRFDLPDSVSAPVNWKNQRLGYLVALSALNVDALMPALARLESDLARLIRRYRLRHRLRALYGESAWWIGASRALCRLDDQLLRLSESSLPVVISGDKGTGKRLAARAIHTYTHQDFRPFVEADCAEWQGRLSRTLLEELWVGARSGSLLLRDVDCLNTQQLTQLLDFWQAERERTLENGALQQTRLMVSLGTAEALAHSHLEPLVTWLEFNALELRLPRLCERRLDIRALGEHFMAEYRLGQGFDFTEDAWELLESYPWPGNVQQLKSMIQKLSVVADTSLVSDDTLLRWFPSLGAGQALTTPELPPAATQRPLLDIEDERAEPLTLHTLFGGLRDLKWEHPALVRALDYMLTYHRHSLSSEHVAAAIKLPLNQLDQLLKYRLGMSFEQMMNKIRVEQAKCLFRQSPEQLPQDVSEHVGFGNQEVFEQTFRRLVGQTPQAYRSRFFRPLSLVR